MSTLHNERRPLTPLVRGVALGLAAIGLAVGLSSLPFTLAAATPAIAAAPPPAAPVVPLRSTASYSAVVDRVAPSVVTVRVQMRPQATRMAMPAFPFFGQDDREAPARGASALGSGVIIREDGLVLTNHHVIADAARIRLDFADGRSLPATLVGSDAPSDLAVLRVDAHGLPALPFGDSERMKVGDVVLAFGNPLGVGQTVTMGIVSAKGRATGVGDGAYEDFLQTDAPINQGNSGGALVNLQGELVGINAQILSPSGGNIGLGFAIPSAMAQTVADQLTREGVVRRARLGVTVQALTPDLAASLSLPDPHGALVSDVEAGGPAAAAGVKQGDVLVEVDGRPVHDANAMRNQIAGTQPGTTVPIVVVRNGQNERLSVRLAERERLASDAPAAEVDGQSDAGVGLSVMPLTPELARQLELPPSTTGVVVAGVDPNGVAAAAGMREGDLIRTVNGEAVTSVPALRAALKAHPDRPALLLVRRNGGEAFVALARAQS